MIFAKYDKVPVSYTMRSVVMATGYVIVIPQTIVIAMNDCLVRIMSSNKNGHFTAIKRSTVIKVKLSIYETTITWKTTSSVGSLKLLPKKDFSSLHIANNTPA